MSKALGRPEFKTNPSIGGLLAGCVETGSLAVLSRAREQAVFRDFRPSLLNANGTFRDQSYLSGSLGGLQSPLQTV